MRLLIYHPNFVSYGGAELVMYKLADALYRKGHEVVVATHKLDQGKYKMRTTTMVLPLRRPNVFNNIVCSFRLSRLANQFDLFIMSNPYAVLDFFTIIGTKTRTIWWCHEPRRKLFWKEMGDAKPRDRLSWHLKRPLFKLLTRLFALRCRAVLVHSNYMKNIVNKALRTRMLCVIPFGIQIQDYPYVPLLKNRIVLYVGRIAEVKNIYRLIEAMALVKYMKVKLVVVGQGAPDDNDLMKRLIDRLDLQENVTWYKSLGNLIPKYVESEVVVYPCINEPFGIVPLEAMAVGRPVIAARIGGPAETIVDGETGVLVNPYDVRQIANGISQLLENKDSVKVGLNCRKRVEDHYTFDRFLSNVEVVLSRVVE